MTPKKVCPNLNHGRSLITIKYCPNCGEKFNSFTHGHCNEEKHRTRRKERYFFCIDCGKNLKENN